MNDTSVKAGLSHTKFATAVLDAPQSQASVVMIGLGDAQDVIDMDPSEDPTSVSCVRSSDGKLTHGFGV